MKNLLCYSLLTFLIYAPTTLTGYGQDDNGSDKIALLTAHVWSIDTISTTSTHDDILELADMYNGFTTLTLSLAADGTYTFISFGPTEGTWELSSDGTILTLKHDGTEEDVHNIITLTSDVLEYGQSVGDEDIGKHELIYRWVKDE